jgi:hypothetical protein
MLPTSPACGGPPGLKEGLRVWPAAARPGDEGLPTPHPLTPFKKPIAPSATSLAAPCSLGFVGRTGRSIASSPRSRCAPREAPLARSASRGPRGGRRVAFGCSACGAARAQPLASRCLTVAPGLLLRPAIRRNLARPLVAPSHDVSRSSLRSPRALSAHRPWESPDGRGGLKAHQSLAPSPSFRTEY